MRKGLAQPQACRVCDVTLLAGLLCHSRSHTLAASQAFECMQTLSDTRLKQRGTAASIGAVNTAEMLPLRDQSPNDLERRHFLAQEAHTEGHREQAAGIQPYHR